MQRYFCRWVCLLMGMGWCNELLIRSAWYLTPLHCRALPWGGGASTPTGAGNHPGNLPLPADPRLSSPPPWPLSPEVYSLLPKPFPYCLPHPHAQVPLSRTPSFRRSHLGRVYIKKKIRLWSSSQQN